MTEGKIDWIYQAIMTLSLDEQRQLLQRLKDDAEPDSGVREPRRPPRPSSAGAIALEIPEEEEEWVAPAGWLPS